MVLLALSGLAVPAFAIDDFVNFGRATLSTGINSTTTTVTLTTGQGARLPAVVNGFNCTVYDTAYVSDPGRDPSVEVVRVTARSSDTLTVTRGQEGTTAANHNTGGSTYQLDCTLTARTLTQIGSALASSAGLATALGDTTGTGGVVRATSPALVTPNLGTPSALVATNATGTATGLTAGAANAVKSATTSVDTSAATAPSSGQCLKASSSTAAAWATCLPAFSPGSITTGTTDTGYDTTARVNCGTVCTIGLPTAVGHDYTTRTYIIDRGSAAVTLDGNSTETVAGALTKTFIGGEIVTIFGASGNWEYAHYSPVAARCVLYFTTTQTVTGNNTKINLNTSVKDVGGMADTTNHVCTIPRLGDYSIKALANFATNATATYVGARVGTSSSSWIATNNRYEPAGGTAGMPVTGTGVALAAGAQLGLYVDVSNSMALVQGASYGDSTAASYLIVEEVLR